MSDTPEEAAARAKVAEAVEEFVRVTAEYPNQMITGWAVAFEYTTASLEDDQQTADGVIVPTFQSRGTSRGIFELGSDRFKV